MSMLLLAIHIFDAAFSVIIISTFLHIFLTNFKYTRKIMYSLYAALLILIVPVSFYIENPLISSAFLLALVFVICLFYKSSMIMKIFLSITITVLSILIEVMVGFTLVTFFSRSMELITSDIYFYTFGVLISKIITFAIVKSIQLLKMTEQEHISYSAFLPLIIMPLTTVLAIYAIHYYAYSIASVKDSLLVVISVLMLTISNIFIIFIFERQLKQEHEKEKNLLIQQQLKLQKEYFQEMAEKQQTSNKAVHDTKNQLYAILAHLNNNETEYAAQKMTELCDNFLSTINHFNSGNIALDALINSKFKRIEENNIEFSFHVFMNSVNTIDDVDLCILVGNALDNAIEACENISDGEKKYIKLKIAQIDDNLLIELTNSCILENSNNSVLPTTKKDKALHGFGMRSMQEITNIYDGCINHEIKNRVFCLTIFVPNIV